jgi:hypothetical protein
MDALAMADAATGLPATPAMIAQRAELRIALRALFDDRAVYMRSAVVATLANTADLDVLTARLLKNQDEIARAVQPYWGSEASKTLSRLLKDQATLALALVRTAKAGDRAKLAAARQKSAASATALGEFLAAADDGLDAATTAQMLQKNLDLTMREATARLVRDWPADVRAWDERRLQTRLIADTFADAMARPHANLAGE